MAGPRAILRSLSLAALLFAGGCSYPVRNPGGIIQMRVTAIAGTISIHPVLRTL